MTCHKVMQKEATYLFHQDWLSTKMCAAVLEVSTVFQKDFKMKAYFDNNGNLSIKAENVTEKAALKLWMEKQIKDGFISENIFNSLPPTLVITLQSFDVSEAV